MELLGYICTRSLWSDLGYCLRNISRANTSSDDTRTELVKGNIVNWIVKILPNADGRALKAMLPALAKDGKNSAFKLVIPLILFI